MPVIDVRSQEGTDLTPLINAAARKYRLPTRCITAQLIAESNLRERAERWGAWPDISFGLGQQTVKYASVGDHSASPENIALVRDWYFDPAHAIDDCARQLGYFWAQFASLDEERRFLETSSRYNGGAGMAFAQNPNQRNIRRGWAEAAPYERDDTEEEHVEGFSGGFSDLADQLGADVVGEAVEEEHKLDKDHTVQTTTKGLMWYRPGGPPLFLPAAQP